MHNKRKNISISITQKQPKLDLIDKKIPIIHDGLEDEIPDFPADEPNPETYEDAEYALTSGIRSGNDRNYGEV